MSSIPVEIWISLKKAYIVATSLMNSFFECTLAQFEQCQMSPCNRVFPGVILVVLPLLAIFADKIADKCSWVWCRCTSNLMCCFQTTYVVQSLTSQLNHCKVGLHPEGRIFLNSFHLVCLTFLKHLNFQFFNSLSYRIWMISWIVFHKKWPRTKTDTRSRHCRSNYLISYSRALTR